MKEFAQVKEVFDRETMMMILACILVVILSITIYKILIAIINKSESLTASKACFGSKSRTYITLAKNFLRLFFIAITALIILQILGVNVSSILTGLGIIGVVAGLAVQDWLKDMIRGSSILSDAYCSVGDIVNYKDIEGEVLLIGLMTTKIREIATGNIRSIANRRIEEVAIVSDKLYVQLPLPYDLDIEASQEIVGEVTSQALKGKDVKKCEYLGISALSDFDIEHLLEITCKPALKNRTKRAVLQIFVSEMDKRKIAIPYSRLAIPRQEEN